LVSTDGGLILKGILISLGVMVWFVFFAPFSGQQNSAIADELTQAPPVKTDNNNLIANNPMSETEAKRRLLD